MDPALARLVQAGDAGDEVAVLARFRVPEPELPPQVRIVARFGDVATIRAPRGTLEALHGSDPVVSVKAPQLYRADVDPGPGRDRDWDEADLVQERLRRRPDGVRFTGRDVIVGLTDWGLDFTHPAFRHPDGRTRILALWDQQPGPDPDQPNHYGYGRIHTGAAIDAALAAPDPPTALGYHPSLSDAGGGTHGTATASIAAGSGWPGGVPGVAHEAGLVFVHVSTWGPEGLQGLGDSVALAEALDFIRAAAAGRPWVANCSLGRHCGPHDGSTLLEQAMDALVRERPGQMIVQSCGNYYSTSTHTEGELLPGDKAQLPLEVQPERPDFHEIDVWYPGADLITVGLVAPSGNPRVLTRPGEHRTLTIGETAVAELWHRVHDPNDGRNQAVIRLFPAAPAGTWQVVLQAADVVDGRFHVWIEREAARPGSQARFPPDVAVAATTTGTICNGYRTISVGAYDAQQPDFPLTSFSSSGPTVDGRRKPDLVAPGAHVPVARSRPAGSPDGPDIPTLTSMNGTSMAAPYAAGAIACLFQARPLPASAVRAALLQNCDPYDGDEPQRAGSGYLNLRAAVESLAKKTGAATRVRGSREPETEAGMSDSAAAGPPREALGEPAYEAVLDASAYEAITPAAQDPGEVLARLGTTPRELFDAFVLGRDQSLRDRLSERVALLYQPYDRAADDLQAGDLLVRGAVGEGHAMVAVLVDGELADRAEAGRRGWDCEGTLPGRYALVIEAGRNPHPAEDRWARRITDARHDIPAGQAVLRPQEAAVPSAGAAGGISVARGEALGPAEEQPGPQPLGSPRFADDDTLAGVAAGRLRLAAPGTPPYPAPVISSGAAVAKVQQALTDLGYALPSSGADGQFGPETGWAVARYKSDRGISPSDPVVGPLTMARLDQDVVTHDAPPSPTSAPIAWGARVAPDFKARVIAIAQGLGVVPDYLMAAMAFESAETFSPSVRNAAGSGAVGLIQFMPQTAVALGTTTANLARMTAVQQLDYVQKYFQPYAGRLQTLDDVYMAILWPSAVGRPADTVLFSSPSTAYQMNRGLDVNGDGQVTKAEAAAVVRKKLAKGQQPSFEG